MSKWEDFDREARMVEMTTRKQAPECVQLLERAIGILADAFEILKIPNISNATMVKASLLIQNFASLKCSIDLALRGYYTQSMNLP